MLIWRGSFPATYVQHNLSSLRKICYLYLQCILFVWKHHGSQILLYIAITWGVFKNTDAWDSSPQNSKWSYYRVWLGIRIFKNIFYLFFRERGREGEEREGEERQCVVTSHVPPTGDLACNPGMCPNWELNWWPFGLQTGTQSTEPHQSEEHQDFFKAP